jgi:hypothetical protein
MRKTVITSVRSVVKLLRNYCQCQSPICINKISPKNEIKIYFIYRLTSLSITEVSTGPFLPNTFGS